MRYGLVLCAVAFISLGGCGGSSSDDTEGGVRTPSPTPTGRDPIDAVVHLEAHYADHATEGTGFIFDAGRGLVMTADHNVEASTTVHVLLRDGTPVSGRVVARAQCHDLALVQLRHPVRLQPLQWSYTARHGDPVRSFVYVPSGGEGHQGMELMEAKGTIKSLDARVTLHPRLPQFRSLIAHETELAASASGTPLLDAEGGVVGVNTLTGRDYGPVSPVGYSYAQSATTIRNLLAELSPGQESVFVGWGDEHRCHREMNIIAGLPPESSTGHAVGGEEEEDGGDEHMDEEHGHGGRSEGDRDKGGGSMSDDSDHM